MRTSRTGAPATNPVSDDEIRSLLDRYRCPMPFHVVRTWLLGNIASPDMTASPTDTVAGLWGGELPAINDLDALNELLRVLLMGLWNRLARHQSRNAPFRMIHVDAPETREGLANIAAIRRERGDRVHRRDVREGTGPRAPSYAGNWVTRLIRRRGEPAIL